ncbi:MAG: SIMPL domain-containing protein [Muribaculaceae bacterium]
MEKKKGWIIEAVILAIGLVVLGSNIQSGINNFVNKDRKVTVKGLSEMEVPANKVTWPIVSKLIGNDMQQLYRDINKNNQVIIGFLKQNGIGDAEISVNPPVVIDLNAERYSENKGYRYNITSVITVTSAQVEKVRSIIAKQGDLLNDGVAIVDGGYEMPIVYEYTSFSEIKPKMMEEAIQNAQKTAEQFAATSDSELKKIISADQGQFSIENRDNYTPHIKKLRVVTTITYSLKN